MKIKTLLNKERERTSDINLHLGTLFGLAKRCNHVTEFGTREGISTLAFLAAKPKNGVVAYDLHDSTGIQTLKRLAKAEEISFSFIQADTRLAVISLTDMLFIDTQHNYKQLSAELAVNSDRVAKYIVLHDTETYGLIGEGGGLGLKSAVFDLLAGGLWEMFRHHSYNNGLTILKRKAGSRVS